MTDNKEASRDRAFEDRIRWLGLHADKLGALASGEVVEGLRIHKVTLRIDATGGMDNLCVVSGTLYGDPVVCFVAADDPGGGLSLAVARIMAGKARWKEDEYGGKKGE